MEDAPPLRFGCSALGEEIDIGGLNLSILIGVFKAAALVVPIIADWEYHHCRLDAGTPDQSLDAVPNSIFQVILRQLWERITQYSIG
jgi:hypothetical protein